VSDELSKTPRLRKSVALGGVAFAAALAVVLVWMSGWLKPAEQPKSHSGHSLQHQPQKTQPPEAAPLPAELMLGFGLYILHCAACHGSNLEGQPNWQVALSDGRMPAPPLNPTGHAQHHPEGELFQIVKEGMASVNGDKPTDMPAFKAVLSDDQISSVLAFVKSSW
jgi:mono/diheme cytochrome c family protein